MPLFTKLQRFLRNLFRSREVERDLSEELQSHLQLLTDQNLRAGMSPEEAQRAARIELGGTEQVKEQVRQQRLGNCLQAFISDCRFALRQLRKSPGFAAVSILTLALGIGANTAVFSILDAVLLRPLPYPDAQRLVKVGFFELKSGEFYGKTSYPDFLDWNEQSNSFDHFAAYEEKSLNLVGSIQPEHLKGQVVSPRFFETLGIQPLHGRSLENSGNQQMVVLSYSLWSRSFASDPLIIGKTVILDGYNYELAGVMPPAFQFPDPQTELWVSISPIRPDLQEEISARGNLGFSVIARLKANTTLSLAQAEMSTIGSYLREKYPAREEELGVKLVPLQEDVVGKFRPALLILMGSAALVLLVACANIGTLLLSRAAPRGAEMAIRSSLGATRGRLAAQLLTESLLLALAGGALGAFLAFSLMKALVAWAPQDIPRISSAHINFSVLCFTGIVSLLTGILFGLAPALQISSEDLNTSLKQSSRTSEGRKTLTEGMIVAEFALCLVLLTAAGLLGKSLLLLDRVDPGFRTDHLLTVEVFRPMSNGDRDTNWKNWTGFYQQLLARIRTLPGVDSAGATLSMPIGGRNWNVNFKIDGELTGNADARIVSNNYFEVMRIPLRSGRYFSEHDTKGSAHVAVINETLARLYWPRGGAIGHVMETGAFAAGSCEIIGVVGDTRQASLSEEPVPAVYLPYTQEIMPWQTLVVRTKSDARSLAPLIRREVTALDPQQPIARIATMDELMETSTAQPRFRTFLLGSFAGLALLLSAVGIYGVMASVVSRRTREIGVRMALGARPNDILKMIFSQSMVLTLAGVAVGLLGAAVATRLMENLLFAITSTDPLTFISVTLLLCSVAFLSSYIPARRAARVDPIIALRYE